MTFEFATATRILFGVGTRTQLAPTAATMGRRVLLVTSGHAQRWEWLREQLVAAGLHVSAVTVTTEPTVDTVQAGVAQARDEACDVVLGIGGGSAVDAGKAMAALLTNPGEPLDYLEIIGRGKSLAVPSAPYIAVPTTAGTGAEVTRNAVLGSPEHRVKVSLRSPWMLPRLAVVDPELTYSVPPAITATTGLDALTQLLEPFVSLKANPMTDAFCREGLPRVARSLRVAWQDGTNAAARQDLALASLFGGLALANAKLGAVHGIAGPLGGMFPAPHGATCAALLPHAMAVNVQALRQREPGSVALARYDEVARLLTGSASATVDEGVVWLREFCQQLEIPPLGSYGLSEGDLPELIENAQRSSSMQGNPVRLEKAELHAILERAL